MSKPRSTDNELFDIFWKEYPPRVNSLGVMEKKRKADALKWFKKHNPSEETVYDMVAWLEKDKENRGKSDSAGKFYSAPPDAIVFLRQERWIHDEIGVESTKTQRYEAHRGKAVYGNNVKDLISDWQGVINDWPLEKLRANKSFIHACRYPEFLKWAKEKRPDQKNPTSNPTSAPTSDADLPPPSKKKLKCIALYRDVKRYRENNNNIIFDKQ